MRYDGVDVTRELPTDFHCRKSMDLIEMVLDVRRVDVQWRWRQSFEQTFSLIHDGWYVGCSLVGTS